MNDWWKAPVLQGPENEYGEYDYMIEELPHDYAKWEFDKYAWRCDSCGKDSHLLFKSAHYFHTLDGYDYLGWSECWKCRLKDEVRSIKYRIKKEIKAIKRAWQLMNTSSAGNFKYWYGVAKKIEKG